MPPFLDGTPTSGTVRVAIILSNLLLVLFYNSISSTVSWGTPPVGFPASSSFLWELLLPYFSLLWRSVLHTIQTMKSGIMKWNKFVASISNNIIGVHACKALSRQLEMQHFSSIFVVVVPSRQRIGTLEDSGDIMSTWLTYGRIWSKI